MSDEDFDIELSEEGRKLLEFVARERNEAWAERDRYKKALEEIASFVCEENKWRLPLNVIELAELAEQALNDKEVPSGE